MPQFMGRQVLRAWDLMQIPFDDIVNTLQADAFFQTAQKQGLLILHAVDRPYLEILFNRILAGFV